MDQAYKPEGDQQEKITIQQLRQIPLEVLPQVLPFTSLQLLPNVSEPTADSLDIIHPNQILIWIHLNNTNKNKAAQQRIAKFVGCLQQSNSTLCTQISKYFAQLVIKQNIISISGYRLILGNKTWWEMLFTVVEDVLTRNSQYQTCFLSHFKNELEDICISDYLNNPSTTSFNTFKHIIEISMAISPTYPQILHKKYLNKYMNSLIKKHDLPSFSLPNPFYQLKLLQLFHLANPSYQVSQLAYHKDFMELQLYTCLADFQTKGANSLAINIYAAIANQLGFYDTQFQAFVDLYSTLDSYGMHLIRDIWPRFYILSAATETDKKNCQTFQFSTTKLLHIILQKVQQHPNQNVPKYCIQNMLESEVAVTRPIFEYLQETAYKSLIQTLNSGTHYNDITHFHQDSKIYTFTRNFYLRYYRFLAQTAQSDRFFYHVQKLFEAMREFICFQHCVMAYVGILGQLPVVVGVDGRQLKVVKRRQVQIIVELNKFLGKLTFRKRHNFIIAILKCIQQNLDTQDMSMQKCMRQLIMKMPVQVLQTQIAQNKNNEEYSRPSILNMFKAFDQQQILLRIKQLSDELLSMQKQLISNNSNKQKNQKQKDRKHQHENKEYLQFCELLHQVILLNVVYAYYSQCPCNLLLNQVFDTRLAALAGSSYAHPIQFATVIQVIAKTAQVVGMGYIADIVKKDEKYAENLLTIIGSNSENQFLLFQDVLDCLEIVARGIQISDSRPVCRNYAKFIQLCISQTQTSPNYFFPLLLQSLKQKICHTTHYKALQDSLYNLFQTHSTSLPDMLPKHRLRLQCLLFTILSNDFQYSINKLLKDKSTYITDLRDYCNLYDYHYYEEYFGFVKAVVKVCEKGFEKGKIGEQISDKFRESICGEVQEAVKSMLHNLDYGVHKKQVISSTQAIVKVAIMLDLNENALQLIDYILEIGEKYWGFQRHTCFLLLAELQHTKKPERLRKGATKLIQKLICIEQYRGQDSAILLTQHNKLSVYKENRLHKEADYDGTAVRFVTIQWANRQLIKLIESKNQMQSQNSNAEGKSRNTNQAKVGMWLDVFEKVLNVCITDNSRERMFMTGSHKTKIKYCQFLMIFPKFLLTYLSPQSYNNTILKLLQTMPQSNLTQIKHYIESIALNLLYLQPTPSLLPQISQLLTSQILEIEGQNSLLKNVSFMVIAGLVLQIYTQSNHNLYLYQQRKEQFQKLYCLLFSHVCSHVAYYRGISQYFCYRSMQQGDYSGVDRKYMQILYRQYLKDNDAIKLTNKLENIVEQYKKYVKNWNIYDNLLNQKPSLNGQVISSQHYIDKIKHLGHQLIKQHKHEDGFMPYRESWKKIIKNQLQNINAVSKNQQLNTYQRKIDPSLDDLYSFSPTQAQRVVNQLKIFVVSAQHVAMYGHMARVGEIMGISELCIPNLNIVDMEQFYNVSVTAQKWLNITEHKMQIVKTTGTDKKQKKSSKKPKPTNSKTHQPRNSAPAPIPIELINKQSLISLLLEHKNKGYKVYKIKKNISNSAISNKQQSSSAYLEKLKMCKKSILIIDQLDLINTDLETIVDAEVCFGLYYSYHVQATIFIWEYFKLHCMKAKPNLQKSIV